MTLRARLYLHVIGRASIVLAVCSALGCDTCTRHAPPAPGTDATRSSDGQRTPHAQSPVVRDTSERRDYHGFLKGSTHVHTNGSGDSSTPVREVARWYAEHGYDFIVVTDHDQITTYKSRDLIVIPGAELTHNPVRCWPPPAPGGGCRIHVNALFVKHARAQPYVVAHSDAATGVRAGAIRWRPRDAMWRVDMYRRALDVSRALGGLSQLNHPTWYRGVDGELLTELGRSGMHFVEIANQGFAEWNTGTDDHPSTEAIWDDALSAGVAIWGIASDDAHDYPQTGDRASGTRRAMDRYPPGTGFVMVRAQRSVDSIRAAMARGDFYSSTGVILKRISSDDSVLTVEVASTDAHVFSFIGTEGRILARHQGTRASMRLPEAGYVRVNVTHESGRKAWVQPLFAHRGNPL